ncbi:MAG: 16S rRNA (adenine(1518)-N(6)/adenine(1519)-N(6))-dimethyltransferase RsmA [bacterium]|nr:16S rRNA (adenine(1518)-N(6)/adenine(1519)-N(6))-dimethyltransferase RsmA [bacterium]
MTLFEETKTLLAKYKIRPEKGLGQSFLVDPAVFDKIIEALDPKQTDSILEIGSGLGILTKRVACCVNKLFACEIDQRLLRILKENLSGIEILDTDILKVDLGLLRPNKCFGNIPYYITTPIILHLLRKKGSLSSILLLTQYEVAERLLAKDGKDFGILPAFIQTFTKPTLISRVGKDSFYPKPKVDSALLKMEILEKPKTEISDERLFFRVIEASFAQRRKTILNSLSSFVSKKELTLLLKGIGIDCKVRPERLTLSDFARITQELVTLYSSEVTGKVQCKM